MKKFSILLLILLPIILFSFPISLTFNYELPIFSLSKIIKNGKGLSLQILFYEKEKWNILIGVSYNSFETKNFDNINFSLISFSPTLKYHLFQTFKFNIDDEFSLDILFQILRDDDNNELNEMFFSITNAISMEYFYTEKLHLLAKTGFTITDNIYLIFLKTGILLDL